MAPLIGIAANLYIDKDEHVKSALKHGAESDYVQAVLKAGGLPVILPVLKDASNLESILERIDGLLLIGGLDIDPSLYDALPSEHLGKIMPDVDVYYMKLIHLADKLQKPVFGICKGFQALNVAYGGTLYQDLQHEKATISCHMQNCTRCQACHEVKLVQDGSLAKMLGQSVQVNSFHHQGIDKLAKNFRVLATSEDGIIEAIEKTSGTYMMGVQWHPEMMLVANDAPSLKILSSFIERTKNERFA
jgi:putative glutamine amidotransferase